MSERKTTIRRMKEYLADEERKRAAGEHCRGFHGHDLSRGATECRRCGKARARILCNRLGHVHHPRPTSKCGRCGAGRGLRWL